MRLVLGTLCLLCATSMPALAAETSPRSRCLLAAEKHERVARKQLDLLLSARRPQLHRATTVRVPTMTSGGDEGSTKWTTIGVRVPSEVSLMQRELRLVEWRKNHCATLPAEEQSLSQRMSVGRGTAWKPAGR
jgi:hypothetical protein